MTIDDGLCKVLLRKMIRPRLMDGQTINYCTRYSGITQADLHSGVPYDEVIDEGRECQTALVLPTLSPTHPN